MNAQSITIHFFSGSFTFLLPVLLLIILLIGILLGSILLFPKVIKQKNKIRRLKKQIKQAELEIKNLRVIPIKDK